MIQATTRSTKPIAMRLKKNPYWAFKGSANAKDRQIEETQITRFGELLYAAMKNGETLEREEVGRLIQKVVKETQGSRVGISSGAIGRWISVARGYFIKEYNETIIYLPSAGGYKIAQGVERPQRVAKLGHTCLRWKFKYMAESTILSPQDMKIAGASILDKITKELGGNNVEVTEMLMNTAKDDMKTMRLEASHARKE